jgi:hypothetical protein
MMRLARRATLLVAFFLLTSAATAHAECTWVLWSASGNASLPVGARDTKSRCEEAKNERPHAVGSAVERTVTFVCLPDTVDPRGPKGR